MKNTKTEKQVLTLYYSQKLKKIAFDFNKPCPKFDIQKLEPYIRYTERRLRMLHQMNEIKTILSHLNITVK